MNWCEKKGPDRRARSYRGQCRAPDRRSLGQSKLRCFLGLLRLFELNSHSFFPLQSTPPTRTLASRELLVPCITPAKAFPPTSDIDTTPRHLGRGLSTHTTCCSSGCRGLVITLRGILQDPLVWPFRAAFSFSLYKCYSRPFRFFFSKAREARRINPARKDQYETNWPAKQLHISHSRLPQTNWHTSGESSINA